ncbi:MAG TPA: HesA/MoeB/ThiF family protein [Candidatus Sphingobacterium stercoripullorum]|uniref:HesA/MoeB/ThiF family protein n=1 Tax=Candidatus Sphingobacterium stercoripullorum TaxID=2838759 RepID=A0A9D1WAG2_9SPHI|nr:HesA/MoeB/ThiF family protein [Candidatus Sphingobacterium stercoripullorum]HLR49200.1 HesA/MoeB/ThiF family protein [Candidatus Sphingobacterium stercoripullorum]
MDDQFLRYSRQIFIEDIGVEGQRRLSGAKVLVVGAGGLGSPIIQYLAAAGVGHLAVIDFDILEIHNLNRQVIHKEREVGRAKVENARRFVAALNSSIHFEGILKKLTPENSVEYIKDYDVIVDGSDNFATRYLVNDTCVGLDKPLVYGSIFKNSGQIAVLNYRGSKNLRDLFPEPPSSQGLPDCDRFGVLGALPGIVGSMMAMHTLQIILGAKVMCNQLQVIDTASWEFNKVAF